MDGFQQNVTTGIPSITKDPGAAGQPVELPYTLDCCEWLKGDDTYWQAVKPYNAQHTLTPTRTNLNGHRYRADDPGVSGSTEPVWPTGSGATVVDGTITWREIGAEDTISSIAWTVPAGITKVSESNTATTATITLSAGTASATHRIRAYIVSVAGKKDFKSFDVVMRPR